MAEERGRDIAGAAGQTWPGMDDPTIIPLRFQRAELENQADLSEEALAVLANIARPDELVDKLVEADLLEDAIRALTIMLPHRQAVWWACLAVRLLPDLAARPKELAAVESAERWVQSMSPADAEEAGPTQEGCDPRRAPGWAAMAAFWSGPSLAPRGQQAVRPAPHLTGSAARAAILLLNLDPKLAERVSTADLLEIGRSLMRGETGRQAQAAVMSKLASA